MELESFQILSGWMQSQCYYLLTPQPHLVMVVSFKTSGFYGSWPEKFMGMSIEWKKMFPTYAACYLWGHLWQGNRIIFNTDNETNVCFDHTLIWSEQSSNCPKLMEIVRRLFLISSHAQFQVKFVHILGKLNPIADALSRLQVEKFSKLAPNAEDTPVPLPSGYVGRRIAQMEKYQSAALAPSTRRVYQVGRRHYSHICKVSDIESFPVSQQSLSLIATHLARSVSYKITKLYIAAIKFHNIELGFKERVSQMQQLHILLRGINIKSGTRGLCKPCLPITLPAMEILHSYLKESPLRHQD